MNFGFKVTVYTNSNGHFSYQDTFPCDAINSFAVVQVDSNFADSSALDIFTSPITSYYDCNLAQPIFIPADC
jgi:hypothetical protein